ncbi:MAG: Gfo/Idh/MocA family oxidoreductase [Kiritimatiellae bacterium]|nr:Gfo/Idh/MocA family oxidoreductase [Kiritimatiellia bacterium]
MTTRRNFLMTGAAFGIGGAAFGQSRARQVAAGARIRLALIGCGAQMCGLVRRMGGDANVEIVAMVDPDASRFDVVKNSAKGFYGSFDFSKTQCFADYREMYVACGDSLDAVFVATPNHHHCLPLLLAIRRGIHVYAEKPLALTMEEVNLLAHEAKKHGVITQVGNYGHSTTAMRMCVDAVRKGVIGEVTDVWSYSDRVNSMFARPPKSAPPATLNWDLWCGGSPMCDYYGEHEGRVALHQHDWHSWIGYGNGSIGNMGTHIMDAPFWALDLGQVVPDRIDVKDVAWGAPGAWAYRDSIDFHFPARGNLPAVTLHWRDGIRDGVPISVSHMDRCYNICRKREYLNFPPELQAFEKTWGLEKAPLAYMGTVFIGTKGAIWHSFHSALRFFPKTLGKEIARHKAGFQAEGHVMEFLNAIRERREANTNFDYSVPLARVLMLGNATARAGMGTYLWDGTAFSGNAVANAFLKTSYRKGWSLKE